MNRSFSTRRPAQAGGVPLPPIAVLSLLGVLLGGCANLPTEPAFEPVADAVEARLASRPERQGSPAEPGAERDALLASLLGEAPLSAERAVEVGVLAAPALQARFESLGIAQAELVQAGLLSNPVLGTSVRFSNDSGSVPNWHFSLVQNLLELLVRPDRVALAEGELERTRLEVADAVMALAADVEAAFYRHQGALQLEAVREAVAEAAAAGYELAQRMDDAGNLSPLELARLEATRENAAVELARSRAEVVETRLALRAAMGLADSPLAWTDVAPLAALPEVDPELPALEALALERRLDLAAERRALAQAELAGSVTRKWRWLGRAEVGVEAERESDGERLVGPNLSLELPLFDRRQAALARAGAEQRRAAWRVRALETQVRAELAAAHARLLARRALAERLGAGLLPARQRVVTEAQAEHAWMLIGVFELLAARREEIEGWRDYVDALRDYWLARAELARAAGGRLPDAAPPLPLELPALPRLPGSTPAAPQPDPRAGGESHNDPGAQVQVHEHPEHPAPTLHAHPGGDAP